MSPGVIERGNLPTSGPWPTVDPFLFCVHHLDHYPASDGRLGPDADLSGRSIGNDFSVLDGWSMYHGDHVPGFPRHPHRGFETVTFVRRGLVDHSDSMGATARYGRGDVQWMTAGKGIEHAEMFPLVDPDGPNPLELFQIWVNLPGRSKMVTPHFSMFWSEDIPVADESDSSGTVRVTVAASEYRGHIPPKPPPDSWAALDDAEVTIWLAEIGAGAAWQVPAARNAGTVRTLYVPHNSAPVRIGDEELPAGTAALVDTSEIRVTGLGDAEVLLLGGRPIAEPVAQYGPFVMNTQEEIHQAFTDYRDGGFGGWPWADSAPNHGPDAGRFAVHADSRLDEPTS
jgi:hypothetical protein